MIRTLTALLGIGLVVLGFIGFGEPVPQWLVWMNVIIGICSVLVAAGLGETATRSSRMGALLALSGALYGLWLLNLSLTPAMIWMSWWNFAFANAFLILSLTAMWEPRGTKSIYRYREGTYGPGRTTRRLAQWSPYHLGYPYGWGYGDGPYGTPPLPDSHLEQQGRGPKSYQRSDFRIEEEINERLWSQWDIDASDIDVQVVNAEVTLKGMTANRRAKRVAEAIADSVRGVKEVHNLITVRSGQPPMRAAS